MPDGGSIHERSASILQFGKAALEVSVIEDFDGFLALKSGWQALEALDPHYTVFLSWAWLERVFRDNPGAWRLVIVRDPARGADPVCILPLQVKAGWSAHKGAFCTLLGPGGQLIRSEYVGWLCHPDYDPDAIRLTGAALKQMPWLHFEMRHEASNDRLGSFASAFETDARFQVSFSEPRVAKDAVDPLACRRVDLPDTYEAFRDGIPSSKTRKTLRQMWRRHFVRGAWRVTFSDAETVRRDIDILLEHWMHTLEPEKGTDEAQRIARNYRAILTNAIKIDGLCVTVLWDGERPIAAQAHILDHDMNRVHVIVAGRDPADADKPLGLLLHAQSIKWAIERGFTEYDFGHDDAPYKFHFGAEVQKVGYIRVSRCGGGAAGCFDTACIPQAEEQTARLTDMGRAAEAADARAYLRGLRS